MMLNFIEASVIFAPHDIYELYKKEKSRYNDKFLATTTLTIPRQHPKSNISKSDASKKEIVHKRCRRPINRS
jgi:hypothetical protein